MPAAFGIASGLCFRKSAGGKSCKRKGYLLQGSSSGCSLSADVNLSQRMRIESRLFCALALFASLRLQGATISAPALALFCEAPDEPERALCHCGRDGALLRRRAAAAPRLARSSPGARASAGSADF